MPCLADLMVGTEACPAQVFSPSLSEKVEYFCTGWKACATGHLPPRELSRLDTPGLPRGAHEAGQQDRQDAGEKDAVKGAGAADGGHRRAKPPQFAQVGQVCADQGSQGTGDVSQK
jgi:hypothetical protein